MIEMVPVAAVLHEEQSVLLILEGQLNRVVEFYDVGMCKKCEHFSIDKERDYFYLLYALEIYVFARTCTLQIISG